VSAQAPQATPPGTGERPRLSLLALLPVLVFAILAVAFLVRLRSGADPAALPSALIGKPVPAFALEPVPGLQAAGRPVPGLSSADLKGQVTVLNIFASWCAPCQIEHPMLMRLAQEPGIRLVGIDYKDPGDAGRRWLERNGLPETFIIGPDGRIRDKLVGILTPENYASVLERIRAAGRTAPVTN
jgi:cytochrome c biogenesis protein CcmG/thiol:disulfide interchange protein DsbE